MKEHYNPAEIEPKWREKWSQENTYTVVENDPRFPKGKYYVLDMFPYPSGEGLHVGHPRGYVASDVFARFKRSLGYNVLHPMGFDSFGLPAEQYAIQTGNNPGPYTDELVVRYRSQLEALGMSYDWDRMIETHDPEYYKWTQWIFLKLFNHYYDISQDKALPIELLISDFEKNGNQKCNTACSSDTHEFSAEQWNNYSSKEQSDILMNYRLAYVGFAEVNWCPELGSVLANDEIVTNASGHMVSERGGYSVEKKQMKQMFMRITAYADRLLSGLETIDWPENIKQAQRNWIGRSEGSEIAFTVTNGSESTSVRVFTTRPDTLFGVTYIVLAPEHALVNEFKSNITNWNEVESYIETVRATAEDDRIAKKEKTGVVLEGITAINPVNGESIPVFIADYVLASYGTGAVMAVPAHDERDWEFAQKYNLPIKRVIETVDINHGPGADAFQSGVEVVERNNVVVVVESPDGKDILCACWKQVVWNGFVTGGIEYGNTAEQTAREEVLEETGYSDIASCTVMDERVHGLFYHVVKKHNRFAHYQVVYIKLASLQKQEVHEDEQAIAEFKWIPKDEVLDFLTRNDMKTVWRIITNDHVCYSDYGVLCNSEEFNGKKSEDIMAEITAMAKGNPKVTYKMRDAIFARQRYWGEPIPLQYDSEGVPTPIAESELPLVLPEIDDFKPTQSGEPPLARSQDWVAHNYELNTMPGWAGSSWYFLRYMDAHNSEQLASKEKINYWKQVDTYVGGTEHTTGHLLYSRFWNKFLYDIGVSQTEEPFKALRNQGLILASDGSKMSKRNPAGIVSPDEMIERFGTDSFRLYQCFIGPFDASQPWIIDGMVGCRRFIEKVWRIVHASSPEVETNEKCIRALHKTIKKVTQDIEEFKFNTAVASLMECANILDSEIMSQNDAMKFVQLLSPFAPYVAEELWCLLGNSSSVVVAMWPQYDEALVTDSEITIALSVNGKPRDTITIAVNSSEHDAIMVAEKSEGYAKWVQGQTIKKIIWVPGKILNFIVE